MMQLHQRQQAGLSIIEVVIAIGIISILAFTIGLVIANYIEQREELLSQTIRIYAAEEGFEMVRFLRDENWSQIQSLVTGQEYYFAITPNSIQLSAATTTDTFDRHVIVDQLFRRPDFTVTTSDDTDGSPDAAGRFVTVVALDARGTTTMESILTNVFE